MKKVNIGILLVYLAGAVLLITAAFQDFALDTALYNPGSLLAQIVGAYGQAPIYWLMCVCVLSGWILLPARWTPGKIIWTIIDAVLLCVLYIYVQHSAGKIFTGWYLWIISFLVLFLPSFLILHFVRKGTTEEITRFIRFGLFISFGQILCIEVLKRIWARPRFWVLQEYPEVPFVPWWEPASGAKSEFMETLGMASDGFKSFPSGHTASAACLLAFTQIALFRPEWRKYYKWTLLIAFAGTAFVAFERMVLGMHFLSDVTTGFLITFTLFLLARYFFFNPKGWKPEDACRAGTK